MVVFTCINCGESIKKPAVHKHYMGRCRGPPNVTCVDCLKDFRGDEYEAHTKCVTEEERYSAKGFVAKPSSNKGEKKQQSWCEAIQSILNSNFVREDERQLLTLLSAHENVPRKKGKFLNFLSNAHRAYAKRHDLVERVWNIIEQAAKPTPSAVSNEKEVPTNGQSEDVAQSQEEKSKSKKRKKGVEVENGDADVVGKKQKKTNGVEGDDTATDEETPISIIRGLIQGKGRLNLYELNASILNYCVSRHGPEKAQKRLKKLTKKVFVEENGLNLA